MTRKMSYIVQKTHSDNIMNRQTKAEYIAPKVEQLHLSSISLLQSPSIDHEIYGDIEEIEEIEP